MRGQYWGSWTNERPGLGANDSPVVTRPLTQIVLLIFSDSIPFFWTRSDDASSTCCLWSALVAQIIIRLSISIKVRKKILLRKHYSFVDKSRQLLLVTDQSPKKEYIYSDRAQTKWKKNALNFYIKGWGRINDTGPENSEAISGNESSSNIDYLRL